RKIKRLPLIMKQLEAVLSFLRGVAKPFNRLEAAEC
ncbi:MAG: hypothetical protein RLZZ225_201, partial [Pseudomonadota bacterium]